MENIPMKTTSEANAANPRPARRRLRLLLLILGPMVVVAGGLYFYLHGGRVVSTDNAYVRSDKLTITSEISGTVVEVAVNDNQRVSAGQVLFRLDDEPYRIAVERERAELESVRVELLALRASYQEKTAAIDEAREQIDFAKKEMERQQTLMTNRVSTEEDLDRARHNLEAARRRLAVLEQDAATVLASLGGNLDTAPEKKARYREVKTKLEAAERDLRLTVIKAPNDGIVTNVANLQVGRYLGAMQPAFSLVEVDHVWVEANMKETDLTHVKVGDSVRVVIDTYPGRELRGEVSAISPATGAEFALIPAQNASGNWVKIVQRSPVEVKLQLDGDTPMLRAGMSANVDIDTGHQRTLGDLAGIFTGKHEG
jgi:membrane fusion protein (multidrug efflux system)